MYIVKQIKPTKAHLLNEIFSFVLVIILSDTATKHLLPFKQESQLTGCLFIEFVSACMETKEMALQRMTG